MGYKLGLVAGIAAGYVLGSRAGHGRYEEIKKQSVAVLGSEPVQARIADAAEAVKAKAPVAAGLVDKVAAAASPDGTVPAPRGGAHRPSATGDDTPAGPPLS